MAKPNPVTLGKAAVYAHKFEKGMNETSAMLKKAASEMVNEWDAEVPDFVDKILRLAVEEEVPEIMNILQASEHEQQAYLDDAKKAFGLVKQPSDVKKDLEKIELPSSEDLVNKIKHGTGPPYYTHQFEPNPKPEPKKRAMEFSGIPADEINRQIRMEAIESIRKGRERLMKQAEEEESPDPLREERFMEECIGTLMMRDHELSRGEAEQQCRSYLNEKLHPKVEEERKSRMKASKVPTAKKMFNDLTRQQP